jgi:hypothetical protein
VGRYFCVLRASISAGIAGPSPSKCLRSAGKCGVWATLRDSRRSRFIPGAPTPRSQGELAARAVRTLHPVGTSIYVKRIFR